MQKELKNAFFLNPLIHKIRAGETKARHIRATADTKASTKLAS
jgi:hypothetical protein